MQRADAIRERRVRLFLIAVLAVSVLAFALQVTVVRPTLWPAGAGLTLDGELVPSLDAPRAIPRMRAPNVLDVSDVTVLAVQPGGEADRAKLQPGTRVLAVEGRSIERAEFLRDWRATYWLGTRDSFTLAVQEPDTIRSVTLARQPAWVLDDSTRNAWLRTHLGALLQTAAFLTGAIVLVLLGTRGMTATLMTLALVVTGIANGGSLMGGERAVPFAREILVLFVWLATPLAFPVIGLAVLYFPTRADILDRHRWIVPAIAAAAAPMFIISLTTALFLIGFDGMLPALTWLSTDAWTFDASFAIALAANVLIVIEGIGRYRANLDANERRRIQIVVFTGVPAVFAYAIRAGVPLLSSLAGRPIELPWLIGGALQAVMLLPAFGLPYVVAVRHVFSPRTVIRRSLQYALARRTLSILVALPIAALVISLIVGRDRPLGDIIVGQPIFFVMCLVLAALGLRYRDDAQRWLDQRFFRDEYDAREILVSLANRVPYETEPRALVAMVLTQIDSALHPESVAAIAGDGDRLEVVSQLRSNPDPLPRESALVTLLRWSDEPLEIFLDDERSPAARLPQSDRRWLEKSAARLLVPIFTGTGDSRVLVGMVVLGAKRSEEPYTAEDRRLLSGIAAQMSVALDLSRLRRRASDTASAIPTRTPTLTPTMIIGQSPVSSTTLAMCARCHRCFDTASGVTRCPDDGEGLQPVLGMPPVVDGKYRVDSVVGRGGMGAVFRARDLRLDRDVAVKIVRADLVSDPEARARFRREAQIVARLQHPAIVTVFDYGNLPHGAAFLVMEYVRGEDLRHLLRREKSLSQTRTVDLIVQVSHGIQAAHQAGVLHRDLKPENVLLPANGAGPKVLDFGVAKVTEMSAAPGGTLTQGATIVGTPAYMAPEQLRGDKLDGRADVYSLGVMTFEALTGGLPFGAGSFIDIGIKQAGGATAIDTSRLPTSVAPVLLRALALNRDDRPATPAAFADALKTAR
jgi:predicted Ser/Thr protein kinase